MEGLHGTPFDLHVKAELIEPLWLLFREHKNCIFKGSLPSAESAVKVKSGSKYNLISERLQCASNVKCILHNPFGSDANAILLRFNQTRLTAEVPKEYSTCFIQLGTGILSLRKAAT